MRLRLAALTGLALAALVVTGCTAPAEETSTSKEEPQTLTVYSSRNEDFVNPLLEKFTADTGIEVEVLHAGDALINRVVEEGANVQADVLVSNDAGALEYLRLKGLLAPVGEVDGIDTIDAKFRAEDDSWIGLSARTRGLIYNKDLISAEELPKTLWELTSPAWKDQFAITRGGNSSMIAHVSALRAAWGDDKTIEWITAVKENAGAITEGHGDIRKAVGAGEFKFGLVNNYYYHQQLQEPTDNNVGILYPDQGAGEIGAFVNAAGVGFMAGGPSPEAAKAFAQWILLPDNQKVFSAASLEVPLNPAVEAPEGSAPIDSYKVLAMPLGELGPVWEGSRALVEEAGLALELK